MKDALVKSYEEEIKLLDKDVRNIEMIENALPYGCFKKPNLEELR